MIDARVKLNKYSNKVLTVVKAKYDLKDKSEAINKFIKDYGPNEVELEVKESYLKKLLKIENDYFKKYGHGKKMSDKELDKLFGKWLHLPFDYDFSPKLKDVIKKLRKKDPKRTEIIYKKVKQIINSNETTIEFFKNLRHDFKDQKRVHIDKSFVLTFKYFKEKKFILFLDFDHHDHIYKK